MTIKRVSKKVFDTKIPDSASGDKAEILHLLRERVKELTALHSAAKILQNDGKPLPDIFRRILALLPPAWQYPDVTAARISFDGAVWTTKNFRQSSWRQRAVFRTEEGRRGEIEIAYLEQRPQEAEGPFLSEERYLINSIAEMLCSYAERKAAQLTILRAKDNLEIRVRQRTAELEMLNETLVQEISTRRKKERKIRAYQERLRRMTSELALAEERERRELASELHDRLGHNLALIKMKMAAQYPSAASRELLPCLNETIKATRELTLELGSPVLYELGFRAAVEAQAEQFQSKYGIRTTVLVLGKIGHPGESAELLLFKALRELLHNAAKHSGADRVEITLGRRAGKMTLCVADNGCGFSGPISPSDSKGFGLFSIKERLSNFGGGISLRRGKSGGASVTLYAPLTKERAKWK